MLSTYIYICGTLYFFSMNGIRQAIAISLFYYSLKYIDEKNLKKYLMLNVLGVINHESAILFIPLYFILGKKIKFKVKIAIIVIIAIMANFLMPFINNLLLNTKYAMYLTNGAYRTMETLNISTLVNILLWIIYCIFKCDDNQSTIYSNIHFCGIIVTLFLLRIPLAMRIFMSFRYIEFLSVPNLIDKNVKYTNTKMLVGFLVMIVYFIYFIYGVFIKNGNIVLPYKTFF